jgi:hypothetical protein
VPTLMAPHNWYCARLGIRVMVYDLVSRLGRYRVLYGTELGSVTLMRVGLFCFPIKRYTQHTHLSLPPPHIISSFIMITPASSPGRVQRPAHSLCLL